MSETVPPRQVPPHTPGFRCAPQVDAFTTRDDLIAQGLKADAADELLAFREMLRARPFSTAPEERAMRDPFCQQNPRCALPDGHAGPHRNSLGADLSPAVVRDEESSTERYERLAAAFYHDTGIVAPGKDVPAGLGGPDYDERVRRWRRWLMHGNAPDPASPVSVPEERQEKLPQTEEEWRTYVMMQGEIIKARAGLGEYAQQPRESVLKSALDALAVAVKGCGKMGPGGVTCGFYWPNLGLYEPCSRECREKIDRALHALLDGRPS